jgi:hypothetical protein
MGRDAAQAAEGNGSLGRELAEEVVFQSGCCLLEAVLTASALAALLTVPAYLLIHRVT